MDGRSSNPQTEPGAAIQPDAAPDSPRGDVVGGHKIQVGDITKSVAVAVGVGVTQTIENLHVTIQEVQSLEDAPQVAGAPPYKGLAYYDQHDEAIFFGRRTLAQSLSAQIEQQPFVTIVGGSGSGKSSLVRAGILPALERAGWRVAVMTPSYHPIAELARAFYPSDAEQQRNFAAELEQDGQALAKWATQLAASHADGRVVLVVDQFEELFTLSRDETTKRAFVAHLLAAPHNDLLTILLIMRSDFYEHCATYDGLPAAVVACQTYLQPMTRTQMRDVILQPLQQNGWRIQEGLDDLILTDVAEEPGALPFLSHALRETWERRRGNVLTLSGYQEAGGVRGAIAASAEEAWRHFDANQQRAAKAILIELTEVGEREGEQLRIPDTRRRRTDADLRALSIEQPTLDAVLDALVDRRLLTRDRDQIEVAHEALIRAWKRLQKWLDDDRAQLRIQRQVQADAAIWAARDRDPSYLYGGARLAQAQAWASAAPTHGLIGEFLHASVTAEEARRADELRQAQLLAAEQGRRAEAEARRAATFRGALAVALALLVIALAAAGVALNRGAAANAARAASEANAALAAVNAAEAQQERDRAIAARDETLATDARRLANLAMQMLPEDPVASIQLSLHALATPRPYVAEAEYSLAQALRSSPERRYLTTTVTAGGQAAIGPALIAIGGDALRLVDVDLRVIETLTTSVDCREFAGAGDCITGVQWGPDGLLLAHDSANVSVWQGATLAAQQSFSAVGPVRCAVWHPQRREIAVCAGSGLLVWTPDDGQSVAAPAALDEATATVDRYHAAWSPDGARVAGWGAHIVVWDRQTARVAINAPGAPGQPVGGVAWSPDGRYLAGYWAGQTTFTLWPLDGEALAPMNVEAGVEVAVGDEVRGLSFTDEGVLAWSRAGDLGLWRVDGTRARTYVTQTQPGAPGATRPAVAGVSLAPDGAALLGFGDDASAVVWPAARGGQPLVQFAGNPSRITATAWRGGGFVATGGVTGEIVVWDVAQGTPVMSLVGEHERLLGLHWLDERRLLSFSQRYELPNRPGALRVWDVFDDEGAPNCPYATGEQPVRCHFFSRKLRPGGSPDGIKELRWAGAGRAVALGYDGSLVRWDLTSGAVISLTGKPGRSVVLDPTGERALTYEQGGDGQFWQAGATEWHPLDRLAGPLTNAVWLAGGLVVGDADGRVELVQPMRGERARLLDQGGLQHAAALGDDRLVVADQRGEMSVFDLATVRQQARLRSLGGTIIALDASRDGALVAGLYASGAIALWSWQEAAPPEVITLPTIGFDLKRVQFNHDATLLAAIADGALFVVDVATGQQHQPVENAGDLLGMAWLPDANRLLVWDSAAIYLLDWDAGAQRAVRVMTVSHLYGADPVVSPDGAHILATESENSARLWTIWPDYASLVRTAHECCVPRPLSALQRVALGVADFDDE